jgi:hypothetical protein
VSEHDGGRDTVLLGTQWSVDKGSGTHWGSGSISGVQCQPLIGLAVGVTVAWGDCLTVLATLQEAL